MWIPHGIDVLFGHSTAKVLATPSVAAVLPARLHATVEGRRRLAETVRGLLASAWDPVLLTARLDAVIPLIEGSVAGGRPENPSLATWRSAIQKTRSFIALRRAVVEAELQAAGF